MGEIPAAEQLRAVDAAQQLRRVHGQPPLVDGDAVDARLPDEPQSLQQPRDARHIMGARLQPVGKLLWHVLQKGLRAGTTLQQRRSLVAAQQQSCALRAVQSLVPRHGDKCRPQLPHGHRQHPCRLGGVQHEGHVCLPAQRRNVLHRQTVAEHVGHMGADHRVRPGLQRLPELRQHRLRLEQRRVDDRQRHVRDAVERPCHRVVLIPGDDDPAPRLHQRLDGDVQPVSSVAGEHHLRGIVHVKQLRRQTAALKIRLLRQPRGGIAAASRRAHSRYGVVHGPAYALRLLQRRGPGIQIDHTSTSLSSLPRRRKTRRGPIPKLRSSAAASGAPDAGMRST